MISAPKTLTCGRTSVAWGNTTDRILLLLEEEGPMTRLEIEQALKLDKHTASSIMARLCKVVKRGDLLGKRRVHVARWVRELYGERDYIRPVYDLGDKPDARKPKADQLAVKRRYWARRRTKLLTSSVFNLGANVRDLMTRKPANDEHEQAAA